MPRGEMRPIYVVIGTRAQLIKMAPIMRELDQRGIDWRFIYTAQHRETIHKLLQNFGLRQPDVTLLRSEGEADSRARFAGWLFRVVTACILKGKRIVPERGVLLTHGDTMTAPLGALLGRRTGCTVVHVEAGLRSFNLWQPFPEELCRLATFRLAHHYLCPDHTAARNLRRYRGQKVVLGGNTLYDALQLALAQPAGALQDIPGGPYAVASIHRYENIFNKQRLEHDVIGTLAQACEKMPVVFVLHPATRKALARNGLESKLQAIQNLVPKPRYDFVTFAHLLAGAEFVISDGGSNQEELSYLGKPCLLLRDVTERQEGLGENAVLSRYDGEVCATFFENYRDHIRTKAELTTSPSHVAVDFVTRTAGES